MGRQASGNSGDPDRLHRVLNAKQRLIGVRELEVPAYVLPVDYAPTVADFLPIVKWSTGDRLM
jgi:hypothetical protein